MQHGIAVCRRRFRGAIHRAGAGAWRAHADFQSKDAERTRRHCDQEATSCGTLMDGGSGGCRTKPLASDLSCFEHQSIIFSIGWVSQPEGARKEVFAGGRLDPQGNYGTPTRVQRQNVPSVLRQQLTLLLCTRIREVGSEPEEQAAAQHHS